MTTLRLACLSLVLWSTATFAYNNGVGRLPPMGWNTWCTDDICGLRDKCSDAEVRSVAQAIVDQKLDKLGYEYVNMDDCWSSTNRSADGKLQADPDRFPHGLKGLADFVHSLGLKLGVYTCVGKSTCRGGRPGSFGHYHDDAQTLADAGVDFVKADNCHKPSGYTEQELYGNFSEALNATGRPILFSLCEWGDSDVVTWGSTVGQMYRVQMDHLPLWHTPTKAAGMGFGQGTRDIIEYVATLQPSNWSRPYGFLDPDFLETLFPSLPYTDSRTEFTFWSLWSAPLLIATDLRHLSKHKASIIANPEVIAIDQDDLCIAGDRVHNGTDGGQVWTKPLSNGDKALVLYNPHELEHLDIRVDWGMLNWAGDTEVAVRDLWLRKDLGKFNQTFTARVRPHEAMLYRVSQ